METAKHFGSKLRKTLAALLATMALMAVLLPGALAVDLNVDVGKQHQEHGLVGRALP